MEHHGAECYRLRPTDIFAERRDHDFPNTTHSPLAAAVEQSLQWRSLVRSVAENAANLANLEARHKALQGQFATRTSALEDQLKTTTERLTATSEQRKATTEQLTVIADQLKTITEQLEDLQASVSSLHTAVHRETARNSVHLRALEAQAQPGGVVEAEGAAPEAEGGAGPVEGGPEVYAAVGFARQVADKLRLLQERGEAAMQPTIKPPEAAYCPRWCRRCLAQSTTGTATAGGGGKCGRCRAVWYCSSACQKADWNVHKTYCSPGK
eukprot:m51a1_g9523 hypothetical protein (268) ;mRNA; r:759882-760685